MEGTHGHTSDKGVLTEVRSPGYKKGDIPKEYAGTGGTFFSLLNFGIYSVFFMGDMFLQAQSSKSR